MVHGVWLQGSAYSLFALLRDPCCACPSACASSGQATPAPTAQEEHRAQEERRPGQEAASARACEHSEAGCGTASRLLFPADNPPSAASWGDHGSACWSKGGESALPPASGGSWNYGLEWEVLVSALRHLTLDLHSSAPLTAGVR